MGQWLQFGCLRVHNVTQAHEVGIVVAQLAKCLLFARTVFGDPRSFLEKNAPIFRTAVKNVVQAILSDDAHAIVSDPRVGKQLIYVLDTAAGVIQIYFTVPIAIQSALDHNLLVVDGQRLIRIVKYKNYLCHTQRAPCRRAGKDDVFGAQPAQHTDILFPKNPAHRIGNVAFSTAIRSHNRCDPLIKLDDNSLGE